MTPARLFEVELALRELDDVALERLRASLSEAGARLARHGEMVRCTDLSRTANGCIAVFEALEADGIAPLLEMANVPVARLPALRRRAGGAGEPPSEG